MPTRKEAEQSILNKAIQAIKSIPAECIEDITFDVDNCDDKLTYQLTVYFRN